MMNKETLCKVGWVLFDKDNDCSESHMQIISNFMFCNNAKTAVTMGCFSSNICIKDVCDLQICSSGQNTINRTSGPGEPQWPGFICQSYGQYQKK